MTKNILRIMNNRGRYFNVRIVFRGDCYGLDYCLTHIQDNPLVEFYDETYIDKFGELGQFISRYSVSTLLDNKQGYGLNLDGGIFEWSIDGETMDLVREWLLSMTKPAIHFIKY